MSDPFEIPARPLQVAGGMPPHAWDDLFPGAAQQRKGQEKEGWLFAQKYLVFKGATSDPRARELLEHWTQMVRKKVLSPNAGWGEYAAANALREFIEAIHAQADLAISGPAQPRSSTP